MNLSTQTVSAQALSVGTFSQIKASMAEQRIQAREVAQTSAEIQGTAAIRDAQAQQEAMQKEAEIKRMNAAESFTNAGTTFAGEGFGRFQEWRTTNTPKAQESRTHLQQAETWQNKLRGGVRQGEAVIHGNAPAQAVEGAAPDLAAQRKRQAMDQVTAMTTEDLDTTLKGVHLSGGGAGRSFESLSDLQKAAIEHGVTTNAPEIKRLRKDADRDVKTFRSEVDNASNSGSRTRDTIVQITKAMGQTGSGAYQYVSSQRQTEEADLRFEEAMNKYLAETALTSGRQFNEVAGSITAQIRSLDESLRAMQERV